MSKTMRFDPSADGGEATVPFHPGLADGLASLVGKVPTAPSPPTEDAADTGDSVADILAAAAADNTIEETAVATSGDAALVAEVVQTPPPKTHRGKGPRRQSTPPAQVVEAPTSSSEAVVPAGQNVNRSLPLAMFVTCSGAELAEMTRDEIATGGNPTFALFLGKSRLVASVSPFPAGSITITVVGGAGRLIESFPVRTVMTHDEIFAPITDGEDPARVRLLADFRGALLQALRGFISARQRSA